MKLGRAFAPTGQARLIHPERVTGFHHFLQLRLNAERPRSVKNPFSKLCEDA
jgi:hypothetical protein